MQVRLLISSLMIVSLLGCGAEEPLDIVPKDKESWQNVAPSVELASPDSLAVGGELTILGSDFIPGDKGKVFVEFDGNYFDDQGNSHPVELRTMGTRKDSGKVIWKLWPNILFHPAGDQLGYFLGKITVVNAGIDGTTLSSEGLPMRLQVEPSIIPRVIQPLDSDCQPVVRATNDEQAFTFMVETVGLRPGTEEDPMTVRWTLLAEQWDVAWDYGTLSPESVFPEEGAFMVEDKVVDGTMSYIEDGGSRSYLVKLGSDIFANGSLKTLKTKKMPADGSYYDATINVMAEDASGKVIHLTIPLTVHSLAEVVYDGNQHFVERHEPVQVSDCMDGGDIGRDVTYSEDESESHSRSVGYRWDISAGLSGTPFKALPFFFVPNLNLSFSMDVNATASTQHSEGLNINGRILPGRVAVFYRQTTEVRRIGKIVGHTQCGQTEPLGEVELTDWIFAPDLAVGDSCTPPSNLMPAEKFLE